MSNVLMLKCAVYRRAGGRSWWWQRLRHVTSNSTYWAHWSPHNIIVFTAHSRRTHCQRCQRIYYWSAGTRISVLRQAYECRSNDWILSVSVSVRVRLITVVVC